MHPIIQGLILGFVIILPGMSGGTVFLILGIYEDMIRDLARLNLKPYLPLMLGAAIGIFTGGMLFAYFFETYRDATAAFLLGCLLASIRAVLKSCPEVNVTRLVFLVIGFVAGFLMVGDPVDLGMEFEDVNWYVLLFGGALASAAMVIPGIPGSSVLIILGIYDKVLVYLREIHLLNLSIFAIGGFIGIFSLVNVLEKIYSKHRAIISYLFAGLILGSSRTILPYTFDLSIPITFLIGFSLVWVWSGDGVTQ